MNIWIKRSLSATAVAGGIVFAGAVAAQADDGGHTGHDSGSTSEESRTDGSLSAPLELGGLSLGAESTQHSSESSTTTHTDEDGTRTSTSSDESSSTSGGGIDLEPTRIDPQALLSQSSQSTSEHRAGGDDAQQSSGSTQAEAAAPVEVGGITVHGQQDAASTSHEASTSSDEHGSHSDERTTEEQSSTSAGFGTGSLRIDPHAGFATEQTGSSERDGRGDDSSGSFASDTTAWAASPIAFEGAWADLAQDRWSEETYSSTSSDEHGTHTSEGWNAEESRTDAGLAVGELTADPAAELTNASDREGEGRHGDRESTSSTSTDGTLAAPFRFEGVTGAVATERSTAGEDVTTSSDRDGSWAEHTAYATTDAYGLHGSSGEATADPVAGFTQERTDVRQAGHGDDATASDSATHLFGAFPFDHEGFVAGAHAENGSATESVTTSRDEDGTHTDAHESTRHSAYAPELGFDGFAGDPAGSFEVEQAIERITRGH
ncbi:hypothetical protein RDV89_19560 [Nocardioides zeae]|uniref:Uncharacterized protein n=1 Tax=Nocardioides imazamoxiresistens TaxID=3231893 RepID=A0ABU3Q1S7_9ACTN|nr:hypothetical protein [Nocardioides zeae]MDT9595294.1 hypothetical protein [Nocardioides zeae]